MRRDAAPEFVRPELFAALGDPLRLKKKIELEIDKRRLEGSLHEFTRAAWPIIEGGTPFVDNWHLGAIAEHLEACHKRQIRNLVINMPPRHMKSISVSVMFPTWTWTKAPGDKWVFSSYAGNLSIRDAVKSRRLLNSTWYQQRWGGVFSMTSDQNQKTRYDNDKTGYRIATSVSGIATGEGGDFIVVDDPHNVVEIESKTKRESVLEWWDQAMSTRFNDPKTGVRILVMQRINVEDLTGHVLKEQGWDHLVLPAEYEKGSGKITSLGWQDPRTEDGELLCPQRFGRVEIDDLKRKLGSYGAAGQLQQRPSPRAGGMVKLAWFKDRWRILPPRDSWLRVTQSWDTAKKAKEMSDYCVGQTWIETPTRHFLVDQVREKMEFPNLKRTTLSYAEKWNPNAILIEDAASGTSLIQQLQEETALPVIAIQATEAKEVRMEAVTPTMEAGVVVLPAEAPWLHDYEQELVQFPAVAHDDQADSTSQYLNWSREPREIYIG